MILIVDDDVALTRRLMEPFLREGHSLVAASNVIEMRRVLGSRAVTLMILDVTLPGTSGFAICRGIREEGFDFPILMLTSRTEVNDRILGLDCGADDYLTKPFDTFELMARVRALLRRSTPLAKDGQANSDVYQFAEFSLDRNRMMLFRKGEPMPLSSDELTLLLLLARYAGSPVSRDRIALRLKGSERGHEERSIDMLVSRLRKRLQEDPANPQFLRTIRGKGYMLVTEG